MAYVAEHKPTGEIHNVASADPEAEYACLDCGELLSYVRQYARMLQSGGTTTVRSHFSHRGSGDGGGCSGSGGGEHPIHVRRKREALQEAINRFNAADYDTEVYIGDKRADALLTFADPHEEYGKGLVIEYQHKNEGKDIASTEHHFARNEYTTVWLWEDQYTYDGEIPDIDLFGGRVYTPWPDAIPLADSWPGCGHNTEKRREWERAYDRGLTDAVVEATIVKDWVVPSTREYWRSYGWDKRFRYSDALPEERYRLQCAIHGPQRPQIEATIPADWCIPTQREYWRDTPWKNRFPELRWKWDDAPTPAGQLVAEVQAGAASGSKRIDVTLPPEVTEQIAAANSSTSDGRRCPRCGAEAIKDESTNWATVYRCPEGHWGRQTDYKGETQAPPYNG